VEWKSGFRATIPGKCRINTHRRGENFGPLLSVGYSGPILHNVCYWPLYIHRGTVYLPYSRPVLNSVVKVKPFVSLAD